MLINWPYCVLTPLNGFVASAKPATMKGNPSIDGASQVSASRSGRWFIIGEAVSLTTPDQIKLWRAIAASAEGQMGQFIVPIVENGRSPLLPNNLSMPHSDGTFFNDGTGYHTDSYSAKAALRVAAGSSEITISHVAGMPPDAGQLFSSGERLYVIKKIQSTNPTQSVAKFWPTAREEIREGRSLLFDTPRVLCRLASDDEMQLGPLYRNKAHVSDLNFIEDTGPLVS